MGIEDERTELPAAFDGSWAWRGGAVAGAIATVAMGVAISLMDLELLRVAIAGLYGLEGSLAAGWIAHLVHGIIFGLIFAAFLSDPALYRVEETLWKSVVAGVVYGVVLTVVGAGLIMPMWLSAVGFQTPPSMPNVTLPSLVWHLVYGTVLGLLFPFVRDL